MAGKIRAKTLRRKGMSPFLANKIGSHPAFTKTKRRRKRRK